MKSAAALRADVELVLASRFSAALTFRERPVQELVPCGVAAVDALTGGLPRGAITEICGPVSSGRTTLALAMLAEATAREEVCAFVDASDSFDPESATAAGIALDRLLWVRCGGNPEHALKAADLLIQGGGFGLVALDYGDIAPQVTRRIPLPSWYRFRGAIENTPAVMVVLEQTPTAKACASLILEMKKERQEWSGTAGCSALLRGAVFGAMPRKPIRSACAHFNAQSLRG